jgi:hypothetical protein
MRRTETGCRLVQSIDDHHRGSHRAGALERALERVGQKERAQTLSLPVLCDGQAADQGGAHQWVARNVLAGSLECSTSNDLGLWKPWRSPEQSTLIGRLSQRDNCPTTVKFEAPFAGTIEYAISAGRIGGTAFRSRAGVFPLRCYADEGDGADRWALWRSRAEQAAFAVGFPRPLAAGIIGAMGELRENVFRHSAMPTRAWLPMPQLWTALRSSFRTQALVFWQAFTNTPTTPIWLTPARR